MPTRKPLRPEDHRLIGEFAHERFMIRIRCPCGHEREPRGEFVRRVLGTQTTIAELRRRFRCSKCGRREAVVEVFRAPR